MDISFLYGKGKFDITEKNIELGGYNGKWLLFNRNNGWVWCYNPINGSDALETGILIMKPSEKTKDMEDFLEHQSLVIFHRSRQESIENNVCVDCGDLADKFHDQLSRKEYTISGLCQSCQDLIWE